VDPVNNPFNPGAGSEPPALTGRDDLIQAAGVVLARTIAGRSDKGLLMLGLRGVGKTVLLDRIRRSAEAKGLRTLRIEAPEDKSLPAMLAPELRRVLLGLSSIAKAKDRAVRGLRALAGFASALKATFNDIEVGLDFKPEPGLADNGNLEQDLPALLAAAGEAAKDAKTAIAIFLDELQYVPEPQLAALITALHRVSQDRLPVALIGAGLPQLRGNTGKAKSYAERLFQFPEVGKLNLEAAKEAITAPLDEAKVSIADDALRRIIKDTDRYPYFLQEWGKHAWNAARGSPITLANVVTGSKTAIAALDADFFGVRLDRLTEAEKRYLRAMAELGPGPHRSGDIADQLGKPVQAFGPVRGSLIKKGMVWSPRHGDTDFTVPLFDQFMKRIMPEAD
jgi:hypothetical protein